MGAPGQSVALVSEMDCAVRSPEFDLKNYDPEWLHQSGIKPDMIERYHVIPLAKDKHTLQLGVSDLTRHEAVSAIAFHTGLHIQPVFVEEEALNRIISTLCQPNILYSQLESALAKLTPKEEKYNTVDHTDFSDAPLIDFVNQLIQDAVKNNVSDIHIEPQEHQCRIRFRRDGLLYEAAMIPLHLAAQVNTRLKILSHLNIAEKRLPQDGRIKIQTGNKIDIRINTCPVLYGEKIVLRLLDAKDSALSIPRLGMTDEQSKLYLEKLSRSQGLILVTGPTGSGKTMTLYSALHHLNRIEKNIATVEDPVEIELSGINQVNIHPRIGLDFSAALRTLLRQDPDIVMIGEIRDKETAIIALQAAQTGHLVLSTLHTNNAAESIARLQSMGITSQEITDTTTLIIAQRLVRTICYHCKNIKNGCGHCRQGYSGRTGIFELFPLEKEEHHDYLKLWDAGLLKVKEGITTYEELTRVLDK